MFVAFDDIAQNTLIIIFTSFIIVMPLVVVNLIAALAIEDIKLISASTLLIHVFFFIKLRCNLQKNVESSEANTRSGLSNAE